MSFLSYCAIFLLINSSAFAAEYDTQPKILAKNGGLILEAAYDRNISLRLSRDSSLLLNNVDIMERIRQHYTPTTTDGNEAKPLDIPTTEQIGDEVHKLYEDIQRLSRRLSSLQNRTRSTLQTRAIRRYTGRLRRLTGRILVLEQSIEKDECSEATDPCKNGGTCYDAYNGYHCECPEGWTGESCEEDIDECYLLAGTDLGCQNNAVCTNTPGSYKCTCPNGFSGTHCRLRNAVCQQYQSAELCVHGICVPANNPQGYTCICDQGWMKNTTAGTNATAASLACDVDVDECEESRNPCHSECINFPGSFKCGPCPPGYTGNGMTCYDIDECATNNGGCNLLPKVRCINTEGSYHCGNCPPGWTGDGHTCDLALSNSCDDEKICHPQAKCEYISDLATCTCPHGMFGHGFGPEGCHTTPITDSCENHICKNNGTCLSVGRSTSCLCPKGYSGALCETSDGCHPNPCENDSTCRPQSDQSFKCICARGRTGKRCEILRSVCSTIQRSPSGELRYPTDGATEYASLEKCAWIIRTIPQQIVNLTFTSFDLEEDAECTRDWLQIHDGNSLSSQLLGRFCGKELPLGGNIVSSQNELFFWFRSDNATNRPGFHMTWQTQPHICGDTLELNVGDEGVIRSPGYPGKTPLLRDCQWELTAPFGYRFAIRIYEVNMGSVANCKGDSLKIYDADLLVQEYCQTTSPEPMRISSNKLKLHLHTDAYGKDSSFQLHYEVESSMPHCGGVFTEASGTIVGPTEPAICLYLIQQPTETQIKIELELLNPSAFKNSFEIFDGNSDEDARLFISSNEEGYTLEPIVSSSNYMLIRYKNSLFNGDFTQPFKVKYSRVCEFRFFGPDVGVITTPNYPNAYAEHLTCTYHIYGPTKTVVYANFTDVSLSEAKPNDVSEADGTNVDDETKTYFEVFLSDSKKQRYYKGAPMELISELNKMTIVFHASGNSAKSRGLRIEYSFEEISCGGVYTENSGNFFCNAWNSSEPCKYILEAPPGKHISLTLDQIIGGDNEQFAQIYANVPGEKVYLLKNITRNSKETFKYNTITIVVPKEVILIYTEYKFVSPEVVCGEEFSDHLYGVIKSPNWPRSYVADSNCTWIITAPLGHKIELRVQNFTLEPECTGDFLEIRNGINSTSPLIGTYCGDQIPSRIPSFGNSLFVKFTTDNSVQGSGFHMTWEQTETGCGGKLTSFTGSIHSPYLGTGYENVPTCDWQIHVAQGSSISLSLITSIDDSEFCSNNRLQIYDGSSPHSPLLHFNCSDVLKEGQLKLTSSTNQMLIIYKTSQTHLENPEFILDYETNCNMVLDNVKGVIESPNFPEPYPESMNCKWELKAGSNNKLKLAFSHLSLEADSMECQYDYVEIWDMQNTDVLKKYHLCTKPAEPIISEGNRLSIRFLTDYSGSQMGFRAEYTRVGCGEVFTEGAGVIIPPNYAQRVNLDCDWYIEVQPGQIIELSMFGFQLDTDSSDCSTDALIVKETKNSSHYLLQQCSSQQIPTLTVTSPSNRLYVHYQTGPRNRKSFKAIYYAKTAKCGGIFNSEAGTITSPNFPHNTTQEYNCKWLITSTETYGFELFFKNLELSESHNCSDNFLKISEVSGTTEILLHTFCRSSEPFYKYSSLNRLVIEYVSKVPLAGGRFSLDYKKKCGAVISADSGYLKSNTGEACIWTFNMPEGTLININILQFECYCAKNPQGEANCKKGLSFSQTARESLKDDNSTRYCEHHQSNLMFEASTLLILANNINFRANFSTTEHACGGSITSARGALASPYYPASYPANVQCIWTLKAAKGNTIQLEFDEMNIAKSEYCNEDFLEVRTAMNSKLLGVYCGDQLPEDVLTSYESVWLRFQSSEGSTGKGFKLKWSYAHLNEFVNQTGGTIESPPIQMLRNDEQAFAWRILVQSGHFVSLHFEHYSEGLSLYDGYDDTSLLVDIPSVSGNFVSSTSAIYLETDNDISQYFLINWKSTDSKPAEVNVTKSSCHTEKLLKSQNSFLIRSPGYPRGYNNSLHCEWIYQAANATHHVVAEMYEVKLEVTDQCTADYVKVSTSTDMEQWREMEKLCDGPDMNFIPFRVFHGTPHLKLDFVSDLSLNGTGFQSLVTTKCGSNLTQSVGFIEGDKLRYETDCVWHIAVKPSKRILLQLDYAPPSTKSVNECLEYAVIYDGFDEHAPVISPGKICNPQNVSQIVLNSTSNFLTVKYNLILARPLLPKRWNLTYREYSACNEEFRLIPEASSINISSPNYPYIPQPHTECEWRVVAPAGETIQVEFIESFSMNVRFCEKEYLELFDGSTSLAKSLGRYCRKPEMVKTTHNILYMHYLTDVNEPRKGFKARISITKCGGSYTNFQGTIQSTGYPVLGSYPSYSQCDYIITQSADKAIRLVIEDIHLPFDVQQPKSKDYLEIIEIPEESQTNETHTYIYGNDPKYTQLIFNVNKVTVRFHTFAKNTEYRGFKLTYSQLRNNCNQERNGVSGHISMKFPKKSQSNTYCRWKITVPKGQRVRLEFLNLGDLKEQNSTQYPKVSIYNDAEMISEITSFDINTFDASNSILSSDNFMFVRISVPIVDFNFKSIKARYSSDEESPCPHHIDENNSAGLIDISDSQSAYKANYYCHSKIKVGSGNTLVFNITTFEYYDIEGHLRHSPLSFGGTTTTNYRENLTQTLQPYNEGNSHLRIIQSNREHIHRLSMSYRLHKCGGQFVGAQDFRAIQPEVTDPDYGAIMCVWSFRMPYFFAGADSTYRLSGNFTFTGSCEREFILIKENSWHTEPVLKICKDNEETFDSYDFRKRLAFIVYQSENYDSQKTHFSMQTKRTLRCGNEIKVLYSYNFVNLDKEHYTNDLECSWIYYTEPGYYLQVNFDGLFFIESSPNCTKDYLEIQHEENGLWISDGRYCGREKPPVFNSTSPRIQIIFRTNEAVTTDGFSLTVRNLCSVTLIVTDAVQTIRSPSAHVFGIRRVHCEYIFQSNETDKLINVVTTFSPEDMSSDECTPGFTAFKRDVNGMEQQSDTHCQRNFAERAFKYLKLSYDAFDKTQYVIEYSLETCGGNITKSPFTIRPMSHASVEGQYAENLNCVWYVTAPAEHSIAVQFKYFDTEHQHDHVSIYSGHVIQKSKLVRMLSGNLTDNPSLEVLVDHNQAVINAISDASISAGGFEAKVVFLSNCNEHISLMEDNSHINLARNFKLAAGKQSICLYTLTAPEGYRIRVDIRKLQINNDHSECATAERECGSGTCNAVEVFDGTTAGQSSMGIFCSSTNATLVSSYGDAMLKFTAKRPGEHSFEITLTMEKSVCGSLTDFVLKEGQNMSLTYPPKGELSYGANVHCTWNIQATYPLYLHFNYVDLQNTSQVTGKCLDYVQLKYEYTVDVLCGRISNYSLSLDSYRSSEPMNLSVEITFHSDGNIEGKGFELTLLRHDDGNRIYTQLSGTVVHEYSETASANSTVMVPDNYNLNFHFYASYLRTGQSCDLQLFKITDLKTNNTLSERCITRGLNEFLIFTNTSMVRIDTRLLHYLNFNYWVSDRNSPPGCGGVFQARKGYLSSPSYENDHNYSDCRWNITLPAPNKIIIRFIKFDMGSDANCQLDNVKFFDIMPDNSEKLITTLCGSQNPPTVTSTSNNLAIVSKKSPNFDGSGWYLVYQPMGEASDDWDY